MSPLARIQQTARQVSGGFPRPFWVLWAGTFVNRMGTFVVPFMAVYLTEKRGLSVTQAGMVAALYGAGGAVAAPLGGWLADHIGRRATMVSALTLGGLGVMALGFATRLEVIAPATFAVAVLNEMYRPAMQAAVSDLVGPTERVRAFGLIYWVINLGFAVGLTLGGLLATKSFLLLFLGDGFTSLLFAFLVWRGVPETRPVREPGVAAPAGASGWTGFFAPYRDGTYVLFLLLSVAIILVFMQHNTIFPLDMNAHGLSKAEFGVVLGLNGVFIVFLQPFVAPFIQRFSRSRVLAVGSALVGAGFGLNAVSSTAPLYALGVLIWTVGEICVLPVANSIVADLAPPHVRGRYQGAYGLSWGVAGFLAPLSGAALYERRGSVALWVACLVAGLVVAIGHLLLERRLHRAREARAVSH